VAGADSAGAGDGGGVVDSVGGDAYGAAIGDSCALPVAANVSTDDVGVLGVAAGAATDDEGADVVGIAASGERWARDAGVGPEWCTTRARRMMAASSSMSSGGGGGVGVEEGGSQRKGNLVSSNTTTTRKRSIGTSTLVPVKNEPALTCLNSVRRAY
jgi:hypothetical protein